MPIAPAKKVRIRRPCIPLIMLEGTPHLQHFIIFVEVTSYLKIFKKRRQPEFMSKFLPRFFPL